MLTAEIRQDGGQDSPAAGVGYAHPQLALPVVFRVAGHLIYLPLDVHGPGRVGLELPPGIGQGQRRGAVEQRHAQFLLQLADVAGERLLGDVKSGSRAGDVQLLRRGQEVAQSGKIHAGSPLFRAKLYSRRCHK